MKNQSVTLSQAIDGYLLDASARQLSDHTIADYQVAFRKLQAFVDGDPMMVEINVDMIRRFLAKAAKTKVTGGNGTWAPRTLSKKTLMNYHTSLSALWTWAVDSGVCETQIVRGISISRGEQRAIVPLTESDIQALLRSLDRTKQYARPGKGKCDHQRSTAQRDRAIIYLLLDTGVRASELCGLAVQDVDLKNRRILVMGKGSKERSIPFSAETGRVIWRYLTEERSSDRLTSPLFTSIRGTQLTRTALLRVLERIGERAGVGNVHPHRFRHTFAITFLRNGGGAYELQMALGHSTLEMVRKYLALANADLERAHRSASPVANWRLNGA